MWRPKPTSMRLENDRITEVIWENHSFGVFLILFFLHQDFWWWDDADLIFGFMPIGLAYHAGFSMACAFLGWLAISYMAA